MSPRVERPTPASAIVWAQGADVEAAIASLSLPQVALHEPRVDARAADRLARAGATHARVAVHGSQVELHELHAGPGDFAPLVTTLAALRARRIELCAWSALTRSSARSLIELPPFLAAHGVRSWAVALPRLASAAGAFTRAVGRLGLTVPLALAALERARSLGLRTFVLGAPSCTLGPFAARALPSPDRSYAASCTGCASRNLCCGVETAYLERFGAAELRAAAQASQPASEWLFAALDVVIEPDLRIRTE